MKKKMSVVLMFDIKVFTNIDFHAYCQNKIKYGYAGELCHHGIKMRIVVQFYLSVFFQPLQSVHYKNYLIINMPKTFTLMQIIIASVHIQT